jgi:hypothetical protein
MKRLSLLSLLVISSSLLGAEPKVVSPDKLQVRGKFGSRLVYLPNQDTPFTGKVEAFYPNGLKKSEKNYKDGKMDGLLTKWFPNGQKILEGNFKDGKPHGLTIVYDKYGAESNRITYKDGEKVK